MGRLVANSLEAISEVASEDVANIVLQYIKKSLKEGKLKDMENEKVMYLFRTCMKNLESVNFGFEIFLSSLQQQV